jgi:hypothetical protein
MWFYDEARARGVTGHGPVVIIAWGVHGDVKKGPPTPTWPRPLLPIPIWGVKPARLNLSSGRHLRRARLPKFSTHQIWFGLLC